MEGKIRFVDYVLQEIESGMHVSGFSYHWFWRNGSIIHPDFILSVEKRKKITLERRVHEVGLRNFYKIDLSPEDKEDLWKAHFKIDEINKARMEKLDREHEEQRQTMQWWP